ncbi:MAG TPA: DUF2007 domain-containing protein [Bacteroidales bacterium]|jgi:hypothetical protein|nr:DUF2007 domain-containing protein [Bacteroidales bacterium]MCZ2416990.1 DUF2007 domain-containing protein [Burkholderiales bacterium]OQC56537.1 MAG: hypothetical protein BWX52_01620 [Bacteroidetes bacterium ADurb.Bin013]MBV6456796.1 hypothetical protein [Bacteroidales bacterium]MCZ2316603.1 DUF2007 domain-containing protein [Bacteroidales bacterium]
MKTAARCNTHFQADVIKGNLENEGFHPVVFDSSMNSILPLEAMSSENKIVVNVPDKEYQAVKEYLDTRKNGSDQD